MLKAIILLTLVLTVGCSQPAPAAVNRLGNGKPSLYDPDIPVPDAAIAMQPSTADCNTLTVQTGRSACFLAQAGQTYHVAEAEAYDVVAFYQQRLTASGWRIDTKNSDLTGKNNGVFSIAMCKNRRWADVDFQNGDSRSVDIAVGHMDITDPCP